MMVCRENENIILHSYMACLASPECGAFYVKENVCNLVNKDAGGAHSNTTTLTPSTVEYFARKN